MDVLTLLTAVAAYVQENQLPVNQYLSNTDRDPLDLPDYMESMQRLLADLSEAVLGRIPLTAYKSHYYATLRLIENLESLEEGFSRNLSSVTQGATSRHDISKEMLVEFMKAKMTDAQIGRNFGCRAKTIYRRRLELSLHRRALMKSTPEEVLKEVAKFSLYHVMEYLNAQNKPKIGLEMARGHLREKNVPHTREQVRDLMRRLEPEQYDQRAGEATRRRQYSVPFVNSLWHIDGHHKLIQWKVVIHGGIDGKSHLVPSMYASDNNRADTVQKLFLNGTSKWGWPQRVRADYGGENLGVKLEMELRRGENRGAFLQGKSTQNQRIERLWGDVRRCVVDKYRLIFFELEKVKRLNSNNALHLFCLHFVYLPMINNTIRMWVDSWNNHSMSTPGLGSMTPLGQWYMGLIQARQNGFHIDYHPWPSDEEEEAAWREYQDGVRLLNAGDYWLMNNDVEQEREPMIRDPHVRVERFGDMLPPIITSENTRAFLGENFGPPNQPEEDDGKGRYSQVLEYLELVIRRQREDGVLWPRADEEIGNMMADLHVEH
ncbi:hypothetical protein QFC21_007185 [Naganishia friedmannii]|uniref:Uncharacterized protein n=1 Tax=Naganishia friedmannii TaxID=89922 RepID=A0ACC2UY21_9TREE|nr:hypothetical protein QFC21_007185 [Naganishia friedmannii]